MDLSAAQLEELELALQRLAELDPAQLPEPAAELVELLTAILDHDDVGGELG